MNAETLRAAPREVRTPRLILLTPDAAHAAALLALFDASLASWGFVAWPKHQRDLVWAEHFCSKGLDIVERGEGLIFNVFEGAACIGRIDLHSVDFDAPRIEVGYVADPRVAGRGLMREAVEAVLQLGFSLGFARIEAFSDVRNTRALHFADSLGFRREGVVRHRERDPGGLLCEQVLFARLPGDPPPA